MWSRRDWARSMACLALSAGSHSVRGQSGALAPLPPSRTAGASLSVAVENRAAFCYLPLTVAERLGYFAAEGLDVRIREFAAPGRAVQALLGGATPFMSGAFGTVLALAARGQAHTSVVLQGRAPQLVMGLSRQSGAQVQDLRDLRGRRVGVTALGSASHRLLRTLMSRSGVNADALQVLPFDSPTSALANFRNGLIDAICYTDPVVTQLEQEGLLRVVADTRTVQGSAQVFGGPMPSGCLMVSAPYLAAHPGECQAMVHAMVRALKWLQTAGPSDINRTVPESFFMGDRGLYLAAFNRAREAWSPDGMMPNEGPATALRWFRGPDEAWASQGLDLASTFTNQFAAKAKARFKA